MNPSDQSPKRSHRIRGHQTFYDRLVPLLLVSLALLTVAMIGIAAAVLFNLIAWR